MRGGSAPGRRPRRWTWIALGIAVVVSLVQSAVITGQGSLERGRIERRIASLRTDLAELELASIEAQTPAAIVERARELGLVFPTEIGVVELREAR